MDSSMKLFFALSIVLMGMTNFYGYMGLEGVDGQAVTAAPISAYPVCNRTLAQVQATGWDTCKAAGTFKSNSKCYNTTKALVYRYDYYRCTKVGTTYTLTRLNCTGSPSPIMLADGTYDIFNRYVQGSGCTGTPPPPPPPPPAANDSSSASTTPSSDTTPSAAPAGR